MAKRIYPDQYSPLLFKAYLQALEAMYGVETAKVLIQWPSPLFKMPKTLFKSTPFAATTSFEDEQEYLDLDIDLELDLDEADLHKMKQSLDSGHCLVCEEKIEKEDLLYCLFEYDDDDEPAFYICSLCEKTKK